jgi:hypothetical protein
MIHIAKIDYAVWLLYHGGISQRHPKGLNNQLIHGEMFKTDGAWNT